MKEANSLAAPLPEQKGTWIPSGGGPGGRGRALDEANKRRQMQEELDKKRKANEEARIKIQQRIEALQKEYNDTLSKTSSLQSQIKQTQEEMKRKQEQVLQLNWKFFSELSKIANGTRRIKESFAMGYKDDKFQDLSNDIKYKNDKDRIGILNSYLKKIGKSTDLSALESAKTYLTEIFSLTKDRFKYEIDQLMMQRDAMINNLKAMADIVKQAAGFRSSAQSSIEANSMEALELTSRRLERLRTSELSPMIEQQKQVKEIEKQVLAKQNQAVQVLERINANIYNVVNKIGTGQRSKYTGNTSQSSLIKIINWGEHNVPLFFNKYMKRKLRKNFYAIFR